MMQTHLVISRGSGHYCGTKTSGYADAYTSNHAANRDVPKHTLLTIPECVSLFNMITMRRN